MRRFALAFALVLAGCSAPGPAPKEEPWFAACAVAPGDPQLPCFTGGAPTGIRGPAVVNLWASWCEPCRRELPVFQRLAEAGTVPVVGVDTADSRPAALSLAKDLKINFPTLYDERGVLQKATGKVGLPITLFYDKDGKVAHIYNAAPLDDATLTELALKYAR